MGWLIERSIDLSPLALYGAVMLGYWIRGGVEKWRAQR